MPGVTKEQIERAKEWDLLSFLQVHEPQELKRCGRNEYCTVSHGSLKISNGKWHWHSRGIGGRTALDYLVKVRGMDFVAAVEALCGERGKAIPAIRKSEPGQSAMPGRFILPEGNRYGTAAVSYLQRRGIDADIISRCIGEGILYESRRYHNCVFVGREPSGKARYAFQRGIYGEFKGDVEGSDKKYGFFLPAADPGSPFLAVAESPIDALSLATLSKRRGEDWQKRYYLSLGGTSSCALVQFLRDHQAVAYISLCLDNDRTGLAGMEKIREALLADPEISRRIKAVTDSPPPLFGGKDYNELLQRETTALCMEKNHAAVCKGLEK